MCEIEELISSHIPKMTNMIAILEFCHNEHLWDRILSSGKFFARNGDGLKVINLSHTCNPTSNLRRLIKDLLNGSILLKMQVNEEWFL